MSAPTWKEIQTHNTTEQALNAASDEITRLRTRLEVREDGGPDGIECRDQTIRMQDQEIERLRAENEALKVIISQWFSVYTDDMQPDGDLLADTDAALSGEEE